MKVKVRIPKMFSGAVVAIAIFAMGLLVGSSQTTQQPSSEQTNTQTTQDTGKKNPYFNSSWWTTDIPANWIIAIFTGLLFCVAVVQISQTRILQRAYIRADPRGFDTTTDNDIIAHVAFVNVGNLPAKKFSNAVEIHWDRGGDWKPPNDLPICQRKMMIPVKGEAPTGTRPLNEDEDSSSRAARDSSTSGATPHIKTGSAASGGSNFAIAIHAGDGLKPTRSAVATPACITTITTATKTAAPACRSREPACRSRE